MHIWQGCGVVIKNRERKRGNDISSRRNGRNERESVSFDRFVIRRLPRINWGILRFDDAFELLYAFYIRYNDSNKLLTIVLRNGEVDAESIRIRFE